MYIHVCTTHSSFGKIMIPSRPEPAENREGLFMVNTKLFRNGNSQAVRIPSELAYANWDIDLVIERHGDELRIRPARRRLGDVLGSFSRFSSGFMEDGRPLSVEGRRRRL